MSMYRIWPDHATVTKLLESFGRCKESLMWPGHIQPNTTHHANGALECYEHLWRLSDGSKAAMLIS